ncbi:chromate transporter [Bacillus massiliglaciei]|uniref:chromate transporter n=1 Tax=Bacillus massiliglaciei TaxID=1816693 RepID=UPI000A65F7F0|nr:chromate transporter [Bacillus massiliglaciei]
MVFWELFSSFFLIGFISFGGGYAMIPVMEAAVTEHGWLTVQQLTDMVAIAGMSPGPIGANMAVLVGYSAAGLGGALIAAAGILLPAVICVVLVATFFGKFHHHPTVKAAFYGLRPIVAALIIYAALIFALSNHLFSFELSWRPISYFLIFGLSLFALLKLRWHPAYVIILSGVVGVALYS